MKKDCVGAFEGFFRWRNTKQEEVSNIDKNIASCYFHN